MKSLPKHNKAIFALIIANIIWGFAPPIFKLSLENIPLFTLAFLRFYFASILLLPFTSISKTLPKKDLMLFLLTGFCGIFLSIVFFFLGLKYAPAINASIIASSAPIFLYAFSIFILKEKNNPKVIIGMFISLFGVLIIIGQPLFQAFKWSEIIGNIFFLLAMLTNLIHSILSKKLTIKYLPRNITYWSFLIGSFFYLPFFIYEFYTYNPFLNIDNRGITGLIFGIFLSSALAYYLFEYGIEKIKLSEIGLFSYIDPITATIAAMLILGEKITGIFILGSIFVFSGIYIAEGRIHYHPLHKLKI
jgi:drug/metabolite transporter (DMT)-like permease